MIIIKVGYCLYTSIVVLCQVCVLGAVLGLVMRGIQSLSRAIYSKLIFRKNVDTILFFSFYNMTFNLFVVFGTFIYGYAERITGSMQNILIVPVTFFLMGLVSPPQVKMKYAKA